MKRFKKVCLGIATAVAVALVVWFGINAADADPSPELQALLAMPMPPATAEHVQAFKYLLALEVAKGQDLKAKGDEIHARLAAVVARSPGRPETSVWKRDEHVLKVVWKDKTCQKGCTDEEFKTKSDRIRTLLDDNSEMLTRIDSLLALGGYGGDLKPEFSANIPGETIFKGLRLKMAQLSEAAHAGRVDEAADGALKIHSFFRESLRYPMSMIEAQVAVAILESNREFIIKTAASNPDFRKRIASIADRLRLDPDVHEIFRGVVWSEVVMLQGILRPPLGTDAFAMAEIKNFGEVEFVRSSLNSIADFAFNGLYQYNRTFNEVHRLMMEGLKDPCVTGPERCDYSDVDWTIGRILVNPAGNSIAKFLATQPASFERFYDRYAKLTSPLEL